MVAWFHHFGTSFCVGLALFRIKSYTKTLEAWLVGPLDLKLQKKRNLVWVGFLPAGHVSERQGFFVCFFSGASLNFRFLQTKKELFYCQGLASTCTASPWKASPWSSQSIAIGIAPLASVGGFSTFTLAVGETTGLRVCAKRWRNESLDPAQELRAVWKSDAE